MPDMDKVIKCLEACTGEQNDCAGHTCPYWDFDGEVGCRMQMELDALELLKEQEAVVRCKDCKHRTRRICNNIELWECNHIRYELAKCGVTDDWFCADGERR